MNVEDLEELLPHGENVNLEYKAQFPEHFFDKKSQEKTEAQAEFIRDVAAMANAHSEQSGYIIYGIKDKKVRREVWPEIRTATVEDSDLYTLLRRYLEPVPTYQYDEFAYEGQLVGMLRIERVADYPHVVRESQGKKIFEGQIFYRRGTITAIAGYTEIVRMIESRQPMVLPLGSEELNRVSIALQAEGWHTSLPVDSQWDSLSLSGYERVAYPGTRRWIQAPTGNPAGMPQFHYLLKRKRTETDIG